VVENKRLDATSGQRIACISARSTSSQRSRGGNGIEVFDVDAGRARTLSLFPEVSCAGDRGRLHPSFSSPVEMQLRRPRQWGACWLAGQLWQELSA